MLLPEVFCFRRAETEIRPVSLDDFAVHQASRTSSGDFQILKGMNEQVTILVHKNPQNTILHTALVGEMDGLLHSLSDDSTKHKWDPRRTASLYALDRARSVFTETSGCSRRGKAFFKTLEKLDRPERGGDCERDHSRQLSGISAFIKAVKLLSRDASEGDPCHD